MKVKFGNRDVKKKKYLVEKNKIHKYLIYHKLADNKKKGFLKILNILNKST